MNDARTAMLGRIRAALGARESGDAPRAWDPGRDADPAVAYQRSRNHGDLVDLLRERIEEFRATVTVIDHEDAIGASVDSICARHGAVRIAVPDGIPPTWLGAGLEPVNGESLDLRALDGVDGVLTACAVAIAETGTVVLDAGPGQGPRRLTLVPDLHVAVVRADQIVMSVPEAIGRLHRVAQDRRPLTMISGPSATSDIELDRVEGVHGPRRLEVVIVEGGDV